MFFRKRVLILAAIVIFGLKALLQDYTVPEEYRSMLELAKLVFYVISAAAIIIVVTFALMAFFTRNKREEWWERTAAAPLLDRLMEWYVKAFVFSVPVIIYAGLIYLAVYRDWMTILSVCVFVAISWAIQYFDKRWNKKTT